jgi:hypothetical protein
MAQPVEIENLPEEVGEEIGLSNKEDGTISSKLLGSAAGKPESAPEEEFDTEREFDKNPTVLYALVQKKLWKESITRANSYPKEASAFISRKEKDGSIRWRLLPLHAAIVFKAPEDVIEALLTAFPKAAEAKDDQGMLPLHLAFRNGASAGIVNLLLLAFPASVDSPDRKGRVPLTLAKSQHSPNREIYIEALEKGPSHYSVAALALSRERIVTEQKEIYEAQLKETLESHATAISEIEASVEEKKKEIEETVAEKDKELAKLHENSQVLVDHVASLEAQLNTRLDTERFLATKIAKLETKLNGSEAHLKERETFWENSVSGVQTELKKTQENKESDSGAFTVEKAKLDATIEGLVAELDGTKAKLSNTEKELSEAQETMREKQVDWDMKVIKSDAKYTKVEIDWANSQANIAILESQLKKRMENEHLLASQVSNLAARLAESSDSNLTFSQQLKQMEDEKATLATTVHLLKKRIYNVNGVMENTRGQQVKLLDDAIAQEEEMAKCMESHAHAVSGSIAQEKEMQAVKDELMALIVKTFDEVNDRRLERLNIATGHGQSLSAMNAARSNVLSCAQAVTSNVINTLENDLDLDTLEGEVTMIENERKRYPRGIAPCPTDILGEKTEEVVEETTEETTEEVTEETPAEAEETLAAPEEETIEVAPSSPKKVTTIVTDAAAEEPAEEEQRSEAEEIAPEEVHVDRVTAE